MEDLQEKNDKVVKMAKNKNRFSNISIFPQKKIVWNVWLYMYSKKLVK